MLTIYKKGIKKGDYAFLNEIPAWVGERSEISNLLREDLEQFNSLEIGNEII